MEILIVLIGISLSIAVGFLVLFVWSINSGQFDDTYTPSVRILFGEKHKQPEDPVSASEHK
jgi:cbb3-type cytochrome oxidase maturation protein